MKIFDCFCFFNELDLLEIRLTELEPVVDFFVIVECTHTWKNDRKPLVFEANKERFARWNHKIRYIVQNQITDLSPADRLHRSKKPENDARRREWIQRDRIAEGVADAAPDDLIIISDLDEIPDQKVIANIIAKHLQKRSVIFLEQPQYSGYLNWYIGPKNWVGSRLVERKYFRSPQLLRMTKTRGHPKAMWGTRTFDWWMRNAIDFHTIIRPLRIPAAGWHFSTIGNVEQISYKAAQHIEAEADHSDLRDPLNIEQLRAKKISHLGLKASAASLASMPAAVRENPERFRHLLDPDFL